MSSVADRTHHPTTQSTAVDPITVEVLRNSFVAVAEEMNSTLIRSSYTPVIYEARDCSVGLYNDGPEVLGQAAGLPLFLGNLEAAIVATTDKFGGDHYREGDVYILNDSYIVGTHLGDITILSPIFFRGELVGFAATRAHWIDIGAKDRVLPVDSTEIFQEGLRLGPTCLMREGEFVQDVVDIIALNSRFRRSILGDAHAQIAACRMGERRYEALLEKYGLQTVRAATEEIFAQSERLDREVISSIPDGKYFAEGCLDNDGQSDDPVWVRVRVAVEGSSMHIDLGGSQEQVAGCVNCGLAQAVAACRVGYKLVVNPQASVTGGTFRALSVDAPVGSMFNAQEPAACQFYFTPLGLLIDLIVKALAEVLPSRTAAAHYGDSMMLYLIGRDFLHLDGHMGGWGAGDDNDGESALINVTLGDLRNFPVELVEGKFPVHFKQYAIRDDSGGAGRTRGGLGTVRDIEVRADGVVLSLWFERAKTPGWGLFDGRDGAPPEVVVRVAGEEPEVLFKVNALPFPRGSVTSARSGGGGGYGPPWERPVDQVREDVLEGFVSRQAAAQDYGVVFKADGDEVDPQATERERTRLRERVG